MALHIVDSPEQLESLTSQLAASENPLAVTADGENFYLSDGMETWSLAQASFEDLSSLQPIFNQREIVLQDARATLRQLDLRKLTATRVFCLTSAQRITFNGIDAPEMSLWLDEILPGISSDMDEQGRLPAENLLQVKQALDEDLVKNRLHLVKRLEGQVLPVVLQMEKTGFPADRDRFRLLYAEMEGKSLDASARLRLALNTPDLDPNSTDALLAAFERNGVKLPNTRDDTLASVAHPAGALLREYRSHQTQAKQAASYMAAIGPDGRIHATFDQFGADTGRFNCFLPNLQGISHGPIRHCFAPGGDRVLICADYSQIELRMIAAVANDEAMLQAFADGVDIHAQTMAHLLKKPLSEVTKEERRKGKAVNFGFIFGQEAKGLRNYARSAHGVDLSLAEATAFRKDWFILYPGIEAWHQAAWDEVNRLKQAHLAGEVRTRLGRVRHFTESDTDWQRFSRRANTPIQGGAGDGFKIAMVGLSKSLPKGAELVSIIHDEIITETSRAQAPEVSEIMEREMIKAMHWLIPEVKMQVDAKITPDFGQKDGEAPYPFDYSKLASLPSTIGPTAKSVSAQIPLMEGGAATVKKPRAVTPIAFPQKNLTDLGLLNITMPMSFVWEKCEVPQPPEYRPNEGFKCRSPFRKDNTPSFAIYQANGAYRFVDASVPKGSRRRGVDMGGVYDFFKLAKGITDDRVGVKAFLKLGGFPENEPAREVWRNKLRARLSLVPETKSWPDRKPEPPYQESVGGEAQHRALCQARGYSPQGVQLAVADGVLRFGRYLREPAWFVTSPEGYNIQARRLDGKRWEIPHFQNPKGMSLKGSCADYPPGIEYVESRPYAVVCEGGPDFIAAYDFIAAAGLQGKVAPIGLLGVGCEVHPSLMPKFKDKKVIFFPHCDDPDGTKGASAGEDAARLWKAGMEQHGAQIHIANFIEIGKKIGAPSPITDLCELLPFRDRFKAAKLFGFFSGQAPAPASRLSTSLPEAPTPAIETPSRAALAR
jgi:DNA polymerase I-like protein with 3'-5' exonuclease and polymerase domains